MKLFNLSTLYRSRFFILLYCLLFVSNIHAQTISTNSEIYNFQIGDIFHYEFHASEPSSSSHIYTNIEILGKYYSSLHDTLFYIRSFALHENHSWAPYWTFSKKTDTIFYANLDSLVNSGNIDTVFTDTVFYGRKVNRVSFYGPSSNTVIIFMEGCGQIYYHYYTNNQPTTDWESRLIYYKKGNEIWGTPIPLSLNQAQNKRSLFKMFPNPSSGLFNISMTRNTGDFEIRVFNASGKLIVRTKNNSRIDLSNEPCGLYYIQLLSNKTTDIQKLILRK